MAAAAAGAFCLLRFCRDTNWLRGADGSEIVTLCRARTDGQVDGSHTVSPRHAVELHSGQAIGWVR